jgi:hypothetical protein
MEFNHLGHFAISEPIIGLMIDLLYLCLSAGYVAFRFMQKRWRGHGAQAQGRLLLQIEVKGVVSAHIATLPPAESATKATYLWHIAQVNQDDLPYFAMTEVPFTHIRVRRWRDHGNVVTVSVFERKRGLLQRDYYWIKEATVGTWPGFPRQLLLPHNFVLKYTDECTDTVPP